MKYQEPFSIIFVVILITTRQCAFSQTSDSSCILDIQISSSTNKSNCEPGDWSGFINKNCCADVFGKYLYALGQQANQSGQIFLNSTEQNKCLISMERTDKDVLGCGIEKLTSGVSGCSSYNKVDVVNRLGNRLKILDEDCQFMDSDDKFHQVCRTCFRRWEDIGRGSSNNGSDTNFEANICRFAVLVTLTSNLIEDKKRVQAIYKCLAAQNVSVGNVVLTVRRIL